MTRVKGLKLKEGRLRLAIRKTFHNYKGTGMSHVWQCSRWDFEQPGLMEGVPDHCKGIAIRQF